MGHGIDLQKDPISLRNHGKRVHHRTRVEPDHKKRVYDLSDISKEYVDTRKNQSDPHRKQDLQDKAKREKE
jgi:hypothetical protein